MSPDSLRIKFCNKIAKPVQRNYRGCVTSPLMPSHISVCGLRVNQLWCLVFLLFFSFSTYGQSNRSIEVIAQSKGDSIWLRWAPVTPVVWQSGNKYGYEIDRYELNEAGEIVTAQGLRLNPETLKPLRKEILQNTTDPTSDALALSELLYPEPNATNNSIDPLQALTINEEIENRYGVALLLCDRSISTAKAAALFWCDTKITPGKRYIYKIGIAHQFTDFEIEPGITVADASPAKQPPAITDLKAEFRNQNVMLQWQTRFHRGIYSFYFIEQSTDGKIFKRVSDMPYAHMSKLSDAEEAYYVDSLNANYTLYHYRILGVTPFGETGPPSNVVSGRGKDDLAGTLIIRDATIVPTTTKPVPRKAKQNKPVNEKKSVVQISWEFPASHEKETASFIISKANSADGPFTDINPPLEKSIRNHLDETTLNNTYYQVRAIDADGITVAQSYLYLVQIEDNTPPAAPNILSATIDKSGIATLQWQANTDPDLMGYRVFRTNSESEDPVEITKSILTHTQYIDTINLAVLNKEVFYYTIAVDKHFNASAYSKAFKVDRPDLVAPAAPRFTTVNIKRDSVELHWTNSISNDVHKYELARYEKENQLTKVIMSWTPQNPKNTFADISLQPGKKYQYKLTAIDSSGNTSTDYTQEFIFEPGYRPAVKEIKHEVNRETKSIRLSWNYSTPYEKCIIYRKINDGQFVLYKTLVSSDLSFLDNGIRINNQYSYKIQLIFSKGIRSALSEAVKVTY